MTSSKVERQTALDIIYSALSDPDASGNQFISQFLTNAKDGYFNLNLLKGLVTELKDYPLPYLQHCINYERIHNPDQQQLELDCEQVHVRIARHANNTTETMETDAFGFLVRSSTSTSAAEDTNRKRLHSSASPSTLSSDSESYSLPPKQQKRSPGRYFTPYQPSFNFKALAEDEGSMDILPVFYEDGKFYQDASFYSASAAEKLTKERPSYNKLDIAPIGATQIAGDKSRPPKKEKLCWNCGLPGHELFKCPESIDRQRVEVNRALFLTDNDFGGKRYYEELKYKDHVSGLEPGRLSENLRHALGMYRRDDEPPYYRGMREHGYPPGYTGTYADQERVMNLVGGNQRDEGVPDLQVFDDHADGKDDVDKVKTVEQERKERKARQERIRMVTYPGLYHTQELPRREQQATYYQQPSYQQQHYQQASYQHQQHQHYQKSSYQQQQQQQKHYYDQAFPPHTQTSSSFYYQQSYYSAYNSNGQQQAYHQSNPAYTNYSHNQEIQHPFSHNVEDDIPPPPLNIHYNDIPPPPPDDTDDDIPPPPPPPPEDSIDDNTPPPPLHDIDDDFPPPRSIVNDSPFPSKC